MLWPWTSDRNFFQLLATASLWMGLEAPVPVCPTMVKPEATTGDDMHVKSCILFIYLNSCFVLIFFKVNSVPNMELELLTPRSRVVWRAAFWKLCSPALLLWGRMAGPQGGPRLFAVLPSSGFGCYSFYSSLKLLQLGLPFLSVLVWGESLLRCLRVVQAWSLCGSVHLEFTRQEHTGLLGYCHLQPLSLGHGSFSQDFCCILGDQLWIGGACTLSLDGKGLPSHTALCAGSETSTDFGYECLHRLVLQSVRKRLGTFALVHTNFSFTGFGIHRALLAYLTGGLEGFDFFLFLKNGGHFHIHVFPIFGFVFTKARPVVLGP